MAKSREDEMEGELGPRRGNRRDLPAGKVVAKPDLAILSDKMMSHVESGDANASIGNPQINFSNVTLSRYEGITPPRRRMRQPIPPPNPTSVLDLSDMEDAAGPSSTNEKFLPSKDHVFLIDASQKIRNNKEVEVEVSTSIVASPARVIRHTEPQSSTEPGNILPKPLQGLEQPATSNESADNKPVQSQSSQSARCLDFESANQERDMEEKSKDKAPAKDDQAKKAEAKKKGQIVPSRYMQPHKGPLKATNRNIGTISTTLTTTSTATTTTKDGTNLGRSSSMKAAASKQSTSATSKPSHHHSSISNKQNSSVANATQPRRRPSSLTRDRGQNSSGVVGSTTNVHAQEPQQRQQSQTKSTFFSQNLLTPETDRLQNHRDRQQILIEKLAQPAKPVCRGLTPTDKKDSKAPVHRRGTTSTPNYHPPHQDPFQYLASIDMSSIGPIMSKISDISQDIFGINEEKPGNLLPLITGVAQQSLVVSGSQLPSQASNPQQPLPGASVSSNNNAKKKNAGKPNYSDQQMLELLYGKYLQYIFLDAKAEKASQEHEKQALAQLAKMNEMVDRSSKEREELEKVVAEREQRKHTNTILDMMETNFAPLSSLLEQVSDAYDKMADTLDEKRNTMETSDIYIPPNDNNAYFSELINELQISESLLSEIKELAGGQVPSSQEMSKTMSKVVESADSGLKEMEKCTNSIKELAKVALDEAVYTIQLLDDDQRDKEIDLKFLKL